MQRVAVAMLILMSFAGLSGCRMMDSMSNYMKHTFSFSKGTDYISGADEKDEAWITEAAAEARGDRPRETEPDPFGLKPYIMSEKAQSIERNLGFD
jgi:hypothetical protein